MLSGIVTLLLMLLFIAIWAWAWQPRHRSRFDDAARLALEDDDSAGHGTRGPRA